MAREELVGGAVALALAQAAIDDLDTSLEPGKRRVRKAEAHALHCVLLRTSFERRTIQWRHRPAGRLEAVAPALPAPPDPWSVVVHVASDGSVVNEQHDLDVPAAVVRCPECGASGTTTCWMCNGSEKIAREVTDIANGGTTTVNETCGVCRGRGIAECQTCNKTGRTLATPYLLVETGVVRQARAVDAGSIPTEVFVSIVDVDLGGELVLEDEGVEITRHHAGGIGIGYRDATGPLPERVALAVDALLAEDPVGGNWRAKKRVLEVRAVPAYRTLLDNGCEAWLVGSPAKVVPESALERTGGVMGWIASHLGHDSERGQED
jgi:hypothetical protein